MFLPVRYAYHADPGSYPSGWNLGQGDLFSPFDPLVANLLLVLTWPVLAAALGARSAELSRRGRDWWVLLLQVATAGLRDGDRAWGAAMRAELANVDERGERRRFALGCAASALRLGPDGVTWLVAAGAAGLAAVGTYAASRASLADGAGGILSAHGPGVALIVFVASITCALRHHSFRDGLQGGALALLAAFIASYGVGISESVSGPSAAPGTSRPATQSRPAPRRRCSTCCGPSSSSGISLTGCCQCSWPRRWGHS